MAGNINNLFSILGYGKFSNLICLLATFELFVFTNSDFSNGTQ